MRIESKLLFGQFSLKQETLLANIVKQAAMYGMIKNTEAVRTSCVRLLATVLPYKLATTTTTTESDTMIGNSSLPSSTSIMHVEMFHLLVSLCLSLPNLYERPKLSSLGANSAALNNFNVLKLVMQAHCVQILLAKVKLDKLASTHNTSDDEMPTTVGDEDEDEESSSRVSYAFFVHVVSAAIENKLFTSAQLGRVMQLMERVGRRPSSVYRALRLALMPFVRCAALFFAGLTGLEPSQSNAAAAPTHSFDFDHLLEFLGIENGLANLLDINSNILQVLVNS